jgi:hypothetical protein
MNFKDRFVWKKKMTEERENKKLFQSQKKENRKNDENKENISENLSPKIQKKAKIYSHRAGDWVCLLCNNHNYSFRELCNRCKNQSKTVNLQQQLFIYQQQQRMENFGTNTFSSYFCNFQNLYECDISQREEEKEIVDFGLGYEKKERTPFTEIQNNTKSKIEDNFLDLKNKIFFEYQDIIEDNNDDSTQDNSEDFEKENKILQFLNI